MGILRARQARNRPGGAELTGSNAQAETGKEKSARNRYEVPWESQKSSTVAGECCCTHTAFSGRKDGRIALSGAARLGREGKTGKGKRGKKSVKAATF